MNNLKSGDRIKVHIYSDLAHTREIHTDNFGQIFEVYKKNGKLGIDWMKDSKSATRVWYDSDGFTPLDSFSSVTVIFEKVEEE